MQPLLALSMHFQNAGYIVLATCNAENVDFFGKMGIQARAVHFDMAKFQGNATTEKAMSTVVNEVVATYEASFDALFSVAREFKPDILMPGHVFDLYTAHVIGQVLKIPVVYCSLTMRGTSIPSVQITTDMREPCWHFQAGLVGLKLLQLLYKKFALVAKTKLQGQLQGVPLFAECYKHMVDELAHPSAIVLLQNSEHVKKLPSDWPARCVDRVRPTGFWVISEDAQLTKTGGDNGHFGGSSNAEIARFLDASSDTPACLGWGSMVAISPEHMAELAVRALMLAKMRGIILGGWAKLHAGLLKDQSLVEYAAKAVLFVSSAPHEMLFPRCCATVHHGGIGTMVAALRSGKPTIVTPVLYDQFENARTVQESGAGIRMPNFRKTTAQALADALCRATTDETMKAKSHAMGEALHREDGLEMALDALNAFVRDELNTGKWRIAYGQVLMHRGKQPVGCLSWYRKMCSYDPFA